MLSQLSLQRFINKALAQDTITSPMLAEQGCFLCARTKALCI
jgi:hypothetical protein